MTLLRLFARGCPCCGCDAVQVYPVQGGYKAGCFVDNGGCGADTATCESAALALEAWNGMDSDVVLDLASRGEFLRGAI